MAGRLITRDDVIRAGACVDGVYKWAEEHAPGATAISVEAALKLCGRSKEFRARILRAVGQDGYGDGYGGGDGDGYGDGDGDGDGDGGGYGDGYGDGYGGGYGYGDGYGDGDGGGGYKATAA